MKAPYRVGEQVKVQVGAESHRGTVTSSRPWLGANGIVKQVVTVTFWHQGRQESVDYFSDQISAR